MRVIPGLKAGASIEEAVRLIGQSFKTAGIEEPLVDARLLLGHALRLDRAQLLSQSDRLLEAREIDAVSALAARRLRREPVARIQGAKEFWSLALAVTPDVLVPRPDTETVVEAALDVVARGGLRMEKLRILDIGTGSGALLLALLSELPNAVGLGTDISAPAAEVARANAQRNALAARCDFVVCDIATLAAEVRGYDPAIALDGGNDGLTTYRAIAADAPRLLAEGARLIVELGAGQEPAVTALFTNAGLRVTGVRKDLAGIARALSATTTP